MITTGLLASFRSFAEARRINLAPLLKKASISAADFDDIDAMLPFYNVALLFQLCANNCSDPMFGLRAGLADANRRDLLFYYAKAAPDLQAAMSERTRLSNFVATGRELRFKIDMQGGWLEWNFPYLVGQRVQLCDYLIASHVRFVWDLLDGNAHPNNIEFDHPALGSAAEYRELIPCRFSFSCRRNAVHYEKKMLARRLPSPDGGLADALSPIIDKLIKSRPKGTDVVSRTRLLIVNSLGHRDIEIKWVSASLGRSARTLQRQLAAKGSSFRSLVDEAKREVANQLIRESRLSVSEIAINLGYSEVSAFSRQYRVWFGRSPRQAKSRPR